MLVAAFDPLLPSPLGPPPPSHHTLQVMQLTWTGETQHVASVAHSPTPLLVGALADSLLLLRTNSSTGGPEVSERGQLGAAAVVGARGRGVYGMTPTMCNTCA